MIVIEKEALFLRNAFIDAFIDQQSTFYTDRILKTFSEQESVCYRGYLWECMKKPEVVSVTFVRYLLQTKTNPVYAMCDLHPQVYFPLNWIYPKEVVFTFEAQDTDQMIAMLPEDCYFFDDTLSWAIALTHEESKPGRRSCIYMRVE